MGYSIFSNSGKQNYGIKHFIVDTVNDIAKVSANTSPGSTIFVIETSESYMLNTQSKWQKISAPINDDFGSDTINIYLEGGIPTSNNNEASSDILNIILEGGSPE